MSTAAACQTPPPAFDPLPLRRAFGSFATGVTVVTTLGPGGRRVGVTANSFGSVSLDPPIVQWSLSVRSPSLAAFDACGRFVVNVLALDQAALSRRFATPADDKFDALAHRRTPHGLPLLDGCAAAFDCALEQRLVVGDHILFLGRVDAYEHHARAGLIYTQGRYAQHAHLEP